MNTLSRIAPAYLPDTGSGLYAKLAAANDTDELQQTIHNIVNNLTFSDFAFVRMNASETEGAKFVTNPPGQLEIYKDEGLYRYDMAVAYAKENIQPAFLSQLYPTDNIVYELNRKFKYFDYYCIPIAACNGQGNVMLTISQRGVKPRVFQQKIAAYKSVLHSLCEAIDYVGTRKFPDTFIGPGESWTVKTIPEPMRVLATLANGDLSTAGVADELGLTPMVAEINLRAARKAFAVKTDHAAIKQAVTAKLITFT